MSDNSLPTIIVAALLFTGLGWHFKPSDEELPRVGSVDRAEPERAIEGSGDTQGERRRILEALERAREEAEKNKRDLEWEEETRRIEHAKRMRDLEYRDRVRSDHIEDKRRAAEAETARLNEEATRQRQLAEAVALRRKADDETAARQADRDHRMRIHREREAESEPVYYSSTRGQPRPAGR